MSPAFEHLQKLLKQLPGLGYRSAERIALHLLVEKPGRLPPLLDALKVASQSIKRCGRCGNITEDDLCAICSDESRDATKLCVVEQVPDLMAIERSGAFKGLYQVLHGKLSPMHGVGPEQLNISGLVKRLAEPGLEELILALSNDVEGEATCHYITEEMLHRPLNVTRIGFGLPSGGGVFYADAVTLKSALEGRRTYL